MTQPNETDNDVCLKVDDTVFPSRRELLSKHSPYFDAMFNHNFIEKNKRIIEIQNVEVEDMKTLLNFVETGEVPGEILKSDHVLSLLQASMMLQFESVQKICVSVITQEWLNVETCLQTMATADVLDITTLYRKARALALWEFSRVKSTSTFLELPIEDLEKYLGSDHLNVRNGEFEVFDAGISWLQEHIESRSEYLFRILQCVRFSDVSSSDIQTMFLYPNITDSLKAQNILRSVVVLKEDLPETVPGSIQDRNSSESSSDEIVVVDDDDNMEEIRLGPTVCKRRRSDCSDDSESYCEDSECCSRKCYCFRVPVENFDFPTASSALPNQCRRSNRQSSCNSLENKVENKLIAHKFAEFGSEETELAVKLLKNPPRKLPLVPCVIGHQGDKSAEKVKGKSSAKPCLIYFDEEKTGQPVAFLQLSKVSEGPVEPTGYKVVNNGRDLYVLGGEYLLGYGNWNKTVWKYDIWKEEWIYETSLVFPRRHHSMCIVDDDLYIIGGFSRHRVIMDGVDRYNIPSRTWYRCPSLPTSMYSAACCVHQGKIYAFGVGVYYYDVKTEVWHTCNPSPVPPSVTYSFAVSHGEWIYLSGSYSSQLLRFSPSKLLTYVPDAGVTRYEMLGSFKHRLCSMCLVHEDIYCFTTDDQGYMFVEKYCIIDQSFRILWKGEEGKENGISDFSPKHNIGCFSMIMY